MSASTSLAYLDHSILDRMTKGDPRGVAKLLRLANLTPVFSTENLAEIQRSGGYERAFLEVLDRIEARYLVPVLDQQFMLTGSAEIREVCASDAYAAYLKDVEPLPELGFGLTALLQKLYGGRPDQSFKDILTGGAGELTAMLESALEGQPKLEDDLRAAFADVAALLPDAIHQQYSGIVAQLDAEPGADVKQFDQTTALGPKVLNNIQRPNVVRKVWDRLRAVLPEGAPDLETFFGIKPLPFEAGAERERTTVEKVNAIYHRLNFVGYYRDSKMSRQRRFVASFSDMTHAGFASFCHVLICSDEDFVMKAAAAYEYLAIPTCILQYRPGSPTPPPRL